MSGWTIETLKEFVDDRFRLIEERITREGGQQKQEVAAALAAQKENTSAAFASSEKAIIKAEVASEKRFESVNEFRATLADQQRSLMPRAEAELRMGTMERDLAQLKSAGVERRGQSTGMNQLWGYIVGGIGLALAIASRWPK